MTTIRKNIIANYSGKTWAAVVNLACIPFYIKYMGMEAYGLVGFFALLPVVSRITQLAGRMTHMITAEHYHDMGKLIFAFVIFWAYIAFSQYMLIWYGDIPEETTWYLARTLGGCISAQDFHAEA